ncbi:hypothetical protein QA635_10960 [Bradyrhizobium brasilense]|uniref:hypothetical protein n=1 Tax=Bradyrhizobium brasilense TaxID=1419277 RepID=UPI0024B16E1F|nr:hypothetical protein [Bradyrhizobium australafricanum]WFU34877.1 hypothetical protein QA635_10960 [Bradyrhizobium australafricanum]
MIDKVKPRVSLSLFIDAQRRRDDPSAVQAQEEIANYYQNAKEGDVAAIRETYAGKLWFIVTTVVGSKSGRIYMKDAPLSGYSGPAFYIKSGKNCRAPKGQCSVVKPTPEVLAHAEKHPPTNLGY